MAVNKPKSTAARAAKAVNKARGTVNYSFIGGDPKKFGSMNTITGSKNKKKIERAEKAGAQVYRSRGKSSLGGETVFLSASKVDVDASKKKTLKASGKNFKSTAMQMKSERERTATRAVAKAKQASKKK